MSERSIVHWDSRKFATHRVLIGGTVAILVAFMLVAVNDLTPASASTTDSFTTSGCSTWAVPAGVSTVTVQATGTAGLPGGGGNGGNGGDGDLVTATFSSLPANLDICVDNGGGVGGAGGGGNGGNGGGASGVGVGTNFSTPLLIASAGGGGGGSGLGHCAGGPGLGGGAAGASGTSAATGGQPGGAGTASAGGAGGFAENGSGAGGTGGLETGGIGQSGPCGGGGGGGGYYGGGGGGNSGGAVDGGGGGGGGSDLCTNGTTSGTTVTSCTTIAGAGTAIVAGSATGDAQVSLTYTVNVSTSPSSGVSTTTALSSSLNPAVVGQSVILTATITGANPTGTISFNSGSSALGTVRLGTTGSATFTTSSLPAGTNLIWAVYLGDDNNSSSQSSFLSEMVNAVPATTTPTTTTTTTATPSATLPPTPLRTSPPSMHKPKVVIDSTAIVLTSVGAPVVVACDTAACKGAIDMTGSITTKGTSGKKTANVVLAGTSYKLAKGKRASVDLAVTSSGKSVLAGASAKLPLRETLVVTVKGGKKVTKSVTVS